MALTVTATDTELQKPVNVVFQQTFLRRAQQMCPYFLGTMPGQINRQMGTSTIKWRRIEQETPSTAALSELTGASTYMQGRDADTPTFTDVLATLSKYGQFYIVNEEVDLYNPNGTTDELVAVLGESAGRSLNQLMRDIMEDNATKRYAGNVASDGVVDAAVTVGDFDRIVNELTKNSARMFSPMSNGSINIGTVPILPGYWGLCSIAGRSIRFIQSEDAGSDPNAGNNLSTTDLRTTSSSLVDLYTTVVYGKDAFGSVGLGKRHTDGSYFAGENTEGFEIIFHPRGSGGISDPFNEIATLAWKAFFAGAVLNANWSRALRTGATNLTN